MVNKGIFVVFISSQFSGMERENLSWKLNGASECCIGNNFNIIHEQSETKWRKLKLAWLIQQLILFQQIAAN